jgi:uridine kinase
VLRLPLRSHPRQLGDWSPNPKLFAVYQEHIAWGRILGVTSVGRLNLLIGRGGIDDFIQTAEALHEKKIAQIAAQITGRSSAMRLILVAGPSSAGKTTFAKRLCTHLRVNGLQPLLISTDDYFVGDDLNPRDAGGNLDYEHIESMDLHRLNGDIAALLDGREIHPRAFDFKKKQGYDRSESIRLPSAGVIVMEGIHCLNPKLTADISDACKFLVYVSALTQLGIDSNSRIATTDNRLIRRMVRDNAHRGYSALATLRRWPSVLHGEQRWIFPFQNRADAIFNSALDYELAVLKPLALPLLNQIKATESEFVEARRISGFLQNFVDLPETAVPGYSILREYIGGSQLKY